MQCPRAIIFDLDDTLAESFRAPAPEVLVGLRKLLDTMPVAIMTGAGFPRMESQFLPTLAAHPHSDRLYIFPNSSSQAYSHLSGSWKQLYNLFLTDEERSRIKRAVLETVATSNLLAGTAPFGEQLLDREAQVAYTHVGVDAPVEVKRTWDPDGSKRMYLWSTLKEKLPEFEILMGGTTTIDITRKEVNKAYGVRWFAEHLNVPPAEMLYVGDALYEGGNDFVVIPTGIKTRRVSGPEETPQVIEEILTTCRA